MTTFYADIRSPVGPLRLVATAEALTAIEFASADGPPPVPPEWEPARAPFDETIRQLSPYLRAALRPFDLRPASPRTRPGGGGGGAGDAVDESGEPREPGGEGPGIVGAESHVAELPAGPGRLVVEVQVGARYGEEVGGRGGRADEVHHGRDPARASSPERQAQPRADVALELARLRALDGPVARVVDPGRPLP